MKVGEHGYPRYLDKVLEKSFYVSLPEQSGKIIPFFQVEVAPRL